MIFCSTNCADHLQQFWKIHLILPDPSAHRLIYHIWKHEKVQHKIVNWCLFVRFKHDGQFCGQIGRCGGSERQHEFAKINSTIMILIEGGEDTTGQINIKVNREKNYKHTPIWLQYSHPRGALACRISSSLFYPYGPMGNHSKTPFRRRLVKKHSIWASTLLPHTLCEFLGIYRNSWAKRCHFIVFITYRSLTCQASTSTFQFLITMKLHHNFRMNFAQHTIARQL